MKEVYIYQDDDKPTLVSYRWLIMKTQVVEIYIANLIIFIFYFQYLILAAMLFSVQDASTVYKQGKLR